MRLRVRESVCMRVRLRVCESVSSFENVVVTSVRDATPEPPGDPPRESTTCESAARVRRLRVHVRVMTGRVYVRVYVKVAGI